MKAFSIAAIALVATTAAGAGAATLHRFTATQTTGSGGSTTFLNPSGGALQGEIASSANTSISLPFGVLGEYNAASGFGVGVIGISTTGYAVGAESLGGNPAVVSISTGATNSISAYEKANGNVATNTSYAAMYGEADGNDNFGVYGYDTGTSGTGAGTPQGVGVIGETANGIGLAAVNDLSNGGQFQASLQDGRAVVAAGFSGNGTAPAIEAFSGAHGGDAFHANIAYSSSAAANEFYIQGLTQNRSGTVNTTNAAADVQMNGDLYITGGIYTGCNAFPAVSATTCTKVTGTAVTRSSAGDLVRTYTAMHASPTLEDEGEAQMTGGYAHVNLDATFARTMSTATPYMVFVTPEGDSALFVAHKTTTGFDVRAVGGARANLAFSYRIVAHPFEAGSRRMAIEPQRGMQMNNAAPMFDRKALSGRAHRMRAPNLVASR